MNKLLLITTALFLIGVAANISARAENGVMFPPAYPEVCDAGGTMTWVSAGENINGKIYYSKCVSPIFPAGMVSAFKTITCPDGWADASFLAGRSIIGAGSGAGLTTRSFGQIGGEEKHGLTIAEMPAHDHSPLNYYNMNFAMTGLGGAYWAHVLTEGGLNVVVSYARTSSTGGNQPFNVMMPYVALTYCVKL